MTSLRFWTSLVAVLLGFWLFCFAVSLAMLYLERRKREWAFVVRHRTRALRAIGDAHRRNLEELALETEKRRHEQKAKGPGAVTPGRNSIH